MNFKLGKKISALLLSALFIATLSITASAATKSDDGNRAVSFVIITDIGPMPFAARHYYNFRQEYSKSGSNVSFTKHNTASWVNGWSGWQFGDISVSNPRSVSVYNGSGNLSRSLTLVRDTDQIYSPDWIGYDCATSKAAFSVSGAKSKTNFLISCKESMNVSSTYTSTLSY